MNIYVGNLSPIVSENNLCRMFEAFGQVSFAVISEIVVKDKNSGQFQGFGFVEMPDRVEAQAAIENLNERAHLGPRMIVNEAHPRVDQEDPVVIEGDRITVAEVVINSFVFEPLNRAMGERLKGFKREGVEGCLEAPQR